MEEWEVQISTFLHRNISAEGCKFTDWLKGRLPWDVKVFSLSDVRQLPGLTKHELVHALAEEPAQSQPWLGGAAGASVCLEAVVTPWHMGTSGSSSMCFGAGFHPAMGTHAVRLCRGLGSTDLTPFIF